jgi:hypothetical protein
VAPPAGGKRLHAMTGSQLRQRHRLIDNVGEKHILFAPHVNHIELLEEKNSVTGP